MDESRFSTEFFGVVFCWVLKIYYVGILNIFLIYFKFSKSMVIKVFWRHNRRTTQETNKESKFHMDCLGALLELAWEPKTVAVAPTFLDLLPPLLDTCDVLVVVDLNLIFLVIPNALLPSFATFLFFWFFPVINMHWLG